MPALKSWIFPSMKAAPAPSDVELLAGRLREAEGKLAGFKEVWRQCNLDAELDPSPDTKRALAAATEAYDMGQMRITNLRDALQTARERQAHVMEDEAANLHRTRIKATEARATTFRRKAKSLGARLAQSVVAYQELREAVQELVKEFPATTRFPEGCLCSDREIDQAIMLELARVTAAADPASWNVIGKHHFLGVRPGSAGQELTAMSLEDAATLAAQRIVALAGGAPVPSPEPVRLEVVHVPAVERLKVRMEVPPAPVNTAPDKLNAETEAQIRAAAGVTRPSVANLAALDAATMEEVRMAAAAQSDATAPTAPVTDGDTANG